MQPIEKSVDANIGMMEAQLKLWGARLDELSATGDKAGAEAKKEFRMHLDELKAKHKAAQAKLDAHNAANHEKWIVFKKDVEGVWGELEVAIKKLTS